MTYIPLTELDVCTVSYGPSFLLFTCGPSAKQYRHVWTEKMKLVRHYLFEANQAHGKGNFQI